MSHSRPSSKALPAVFFPDHLLTATTYLAANDSALARVWVSNEWFGNHVAE